MKLTAIPPVVDWFWKMTGDDDSRVAYDAAREELRLVEEALTAAEGISFAIWESDENEQVAAGKFTAALAALRAFGVPASEEDK